MKNKLVRSAGVLFFMGFFAGGVVFSSFLGESPKAANLTDAKVVVNHLAKDQFTLGTHTFWVVRWSLYIFSTLALILRSYRRMTRSPIRIAEQRRSEGLSGLALKTLLCIVVYEFALVPSFVVEPADGR